MQIAIVIINKNSEFFAERLMETLIRSCKKMECKEIIVVDNASTDGSIQVFEEFSRSLTLFPHTLTQKYGCL
jgi:glycosyltransferase involved in cell wall biosynthesis